jgi:hypothetical protein
MMFEFTRMNDLGGGRKVDRPEMITYGNSDFLA